MKTCPLLGRSPLFRLSVKREFTVKSIEVVVFTKATIIGIISSTCRHCTLGNSIMSSDSYPIPILSLFLLYHPCIPYILIQDILFSSVLPFLLHACMYSHQMYNSNDGLAPKIGLSTTQSWMVTPMNKHFPIMGKCISLL